MNYYVYGLLIWLVITATLFVCFLSELGYLWVNDTEFEESKFLHFVNKYIAEYEDTPYVFLCFLVLAVCSFAWNLILPFATIYLILKSIRFVVRLKKSVIKLTKSEKE